jgi:phosphatidylglycerol:prolipoprotein diacylglycerol transferase
VWYGGFFSGLAGAAYYIRRQKLSAWNAMDLVAPYLALAQAVGRIGCFMNGCCYGAPNRPVQLYAAGWLFAIFAILCFWRERRRFDGEIFLGYCMLYGVKRFLIEFFRIDNPRILSSLTMSQLLSVLLFIAALFVFIMKANGWKRRSSH